MMMDEFKKFQGENARPITSQEYKLVEYVYTYHPCNFSKEATANLYNEFGIIIFYDMFYTAKKADKAERKLQEARIKYEEAKQYYENVDKVNLDVLDYEDVINK